VDVVLPLVHGTYGEDGTLQGLLEMTGTRYAGAGVFASAAGMDKEYMKLIFAARGLPIGRYVVVRDRDWRPPEPEGAAAATAMTERKRVLDDIAELGWPVFVKPIWQAVQYPLDGSAGFLPQRRPTTGPRPFTGP
jgi:D-alanine-D-alanine ligase